MQGSLDTFLSGRFWPIFFTLGGIALAFWIATLIPHTLTIFALAGLIAFGVAPIIRDLARSLPRVWAIFFVYLGLLLVLGVLVLLVVPAAIAQAQMFVSQSPTQLAQLQLLSTGIDHALQQRFGHSYAVGVEEVRSMLNERLSIIASTAFSSIGVAILQVFTALFVVVSALVVSVFFVGNAESLSAGFRSLFPVSRRHLASEFEHELARVFGGFVAGQFILSVVTGSAVWIALYCMQAPFAVLAGIATGIGYAVPFVGMLVIQIGAAVLAVPYGWPMVIRVSMAIFLIARIADNFLVPKIMSESVGVSPIIIIFSVFAGGELFGFIGLIMGVPAAAFAKTLWTVVQHARAEMKLAIPREIPESELH